MKRSMLAYLGGLSCVALLASGTVAKALMIAPQPVPMRVASADLVVVGKVTGFADKLVKVKQNDNDMNPIEYQVAIVKVQKALVGGGKGMKEIRVGFIPAPAGGDVAPGGGPGIRPHIRIRRYPTFSLSLNQEACMFLNKHPKADFYVGQGFAGLINKEGNANFEKELAEVKQAAKLLADPKAGLKSDNADERLLTVGMLITRYRTPQQPQVGEPKTEPIDAKESKLILETLAKADWKQMPTRPFQMTPQTVFFRLGLTEKDGWKQPQDFQKLPDAAKKWLEDNADTYRIQRFVATKATEEKKD
jgi:hypothetical protein